MEDKRVYYLSRTIIILICYMFYVNVISKIFQLIGMNHELIIMFVSDVIFFMAMLFIYKNSLKKDFIIWKKEYPIKQKIKTIAKWSIIILLFNMVMGMITELFFSNIAHKVDENAMAVTQLFDASFLYFLFKTLLFAPIVEELLFKKSIRDIVKNDIAFIIIGSSIYTILNFLYTSSPILLLDFIKYFIFSTILSIAYLKNHDNIIVVILIKFMYNLIPTIVLIATLLSGGTI